MAPTNFLSDFNGAVQLHHPEADPVVDVGYSKDLAKVLGENNVDFELYLYKTGDHNLGSGVFGTAMRRTVEFFARQLNG